jgi:hypothetical protein
MRSSAISCSCESHERSVDLILAWTHAANGDPAGMPLVFQGGANGFGDLPAR